VVGVYVDDLVITSSDCDDIKSFKEERTVTFKMSDLGLLPLYSREFCVLDHWL
jgi:hypothetical protein